VEIKIGTKAEWCERKPDSPCLRLQVPKKNLVKPGELELADLK
jgi:hypothetical protein